MVKRLFKRSIACFLAVIMIAASLPLTALADATTDATQVEETLVSKCDGKVGLVVDALGNGRCNGHDYNIVNDNSNNQFTFAFWKYDSSKVNALQDTQINNANFTFTVVNSAMSRCQGFTVYYATKNTDKLNQGETGGSAWAAYNSIYTGSGHIENTVSYFGLVEVPGGKISSTDLINAGANKEFTVDVASAFNDSITNKRDYVTLVLMQSGVSTNSSSRNGYTDTHIYDNTPDITCKYNVTVEAIPGLEGINQAITEYETKMAQIGTDDLVYTNMAPAYAAYQKAIKCRDAYQYGTKGAVTQDTVTTVAEELLAKTAEMKTWVDNVTGQMTSKVPSFTSNKTRKEVVNSSEFTYYSNILYTEDCVGKNNGTSGGDSSGMAISFPLAGNVYVQIYYPNTILLYDGVTPARMPIMFMAKVDGNKERYIYQVYPAAVDTTDSWKTTKVGYDVEFKSVYLTSYTTNRDAAWKGEDGTNNLDFNNSRSGGFLVNVAPATDTNFRSEQLGYFWPNAYWNAYAGSFEIDGSNFETKNATSGWTTVGNQWAYYGGSTTSYTSTPDESVKGYASSNAADGGTVKNINVINYKGLVTAIRNSKLQTLLKDVSKYKEGGLTSLIDLYDQATGKAQRSEIENINLDNFRTYGQALTQILKSFNTIEKKVTADTGNAYYNELKTLTADCKKIYEIGNPDYTKYTQEYWDPFKTEYEKVAKFFADLYPNGQLKMADAEPLIQPLKTAKDNLKKGMIREVVDTATLEIALNNAEILAHNADHFSNAVPDTEILALVEQIKTEVWNGIDHFGDDTAKLEKSTENQAKVDGYVNQLCTYISAAVLNFDYQISDRSMNSVLAEAKKVNPASYGNYVVLQDAMNECETFIAQTKDFDGKIQDVISTALVNYETLLSKLYSAYNGLKAPFNKITNGAVANSGQPVKTQIDSQQQPKKFKLSWEVTTGTVIFQTQREGFTYNLPKSTWGLYSNQTGTDFEAMVDGLIIDKDPTVEMATGEITTANVWDLGWPTGNALSGPQLEKYAAVTQFNAVADVALTDAVISQKSNAKALGIDKNGNIINTPGYNFIDDIKTVEGVDKISRGGIYAKDGWTYFNTKTVVTVPRYNDSVSLEKGPASGSINIDRTSNYFGMVYFWKFADVAFRSYAGYSFERARSPLTIGVVNVVPLFELMSDINSAEFQAQKSKYTTASWDTMMKKYSEANSDFNYSSMDYSTIVQTVEQRFVDLYNAKKNLQFAASNAGLKKALADAKNAFENDQNKVKPESWTAFDTAYKNALAKFNNEYSDLNITNVALSDQSVIDQYTNALIEAFNALIYPIDFDPVDKAVSALIDKVAAAGDYVYTYDSVKSLHDAIKSLKYYMMSKPERDKCYTDTLLDDGSKMTDAVNAEIASIPELEKLLKTPTIDSSALEGAKKEISSKLLDPDAYDKTVAQEALNKLENKATYTLVNSNINCVKFASQEQLDAEVANALSSVQLKEYSVTIVPNGDTSKKYTLKHKYGEEIKVSLPDNSVVDWYYEMTSPSGRNVSKKLYATTDELIFVVRGDTTLTTKSATATNQHRVTYVNGINSSVVASDYVADGTQVTLDSTIAPNLPYYEFDSFVVDGQTKNNGDKITVNKDTTITILYRNDFKGNEDEKPSYNIYVSGLGDPYMAADNKIKIDSLSYNDEVSFKMGDYENQKGGYAFANGYGGIGLKYQVSRYNGTKFTTEDILQGAYDLDTGLGRLVKKYDLSDDTLGAENVYAWLKLDIDNVADFEASNLWNYGEYGLFNGTTTGDGTTYRLDKQYFVNAKPTVIAYGTDYTFRVHENAYLIAVDKAQFDQAVADGIIDDPYLSPDQVKVVTKPELVIVQSEKLSIISSYAIPEGCTMVEKGLLVKINKNSPDVDGSDLKVENAGNNGVFRLKSNYQTDGNQFVISVNTKSLNNANVQDVGLIWVAYVNYRNANGELITAYSPVTTPSNVGTY